MTARETLRLLGPLVMLEGLALAIGGRHTLRVAEKLGPRWYNAWLGPLAKLPSPVLRALGGLEFLFGLQVWAMAPPAPRLVEELASLTLQPAETLWRDTFAAPAERAFADVLRESVPPGARVLDLGCGDGDNLARLLRLDLPFASYLGLDPSAGRLARARARFADLPKVAFIRNDLYTEQLPTGEFDLILSTWALDLIYDPFELIVRAMRQLRHGGHAILLYASQPAEPPPVLVDWLGKLTGRRLRPTNLYEGLPAFVARDSFAGETASLVILENKEPLPTPISPRSRLDPDTRSGFGRPAGQPGRGRWPTGRR